MSKRLLLFLVLKSENTRFESTKQINTPINGKISKIKLINENQNISQDGVLLYDVWLTRAIIFYAGGREISFEKDEVPFSEEIIIRRGYNLENQISNEKDFLNGWNDGLIPECHREIVTIA